MLHKHVLAHEHLCGHRWLETVWSPYSWETFNEAVFPSLNGKQCPRCNANLSINNTLRWKVAAGTNPQHLDTWNSQTKASLWSHVDNLRSLHDMKSIARQRVIQAGGTSVRDHFSHFSKAYRFDRDDY